MKLPKGVKVVQEIGDLGRPKECMKLLPGGGKCPNKARWTPQLHFHAKGFSRGDGEITMEVGISVCDEHKVDQEIREVFHPSRNPEGARKILDSVRALGKVEPDLEDPRITWREL